MGFEMPPAPTERTTGPDGNTVALTQRGDVVTSDAPSDVSCRRPERLGRVTCEEVLTVVYVSSSLTLW